METMLKIGELLPGILMEVVVAIVCGGLIGLERGLHQRTASLRDNILICLGAVLYMNLAELIFLGAEGTVDGDLSRIAAQVVTGVAILGAGIIMQTKGTRTGLTGAATIWVVAAIGLIIGADQSLLGMLVTGITLLVLTLLHGLERGLEARPGSFHLKLVVREDSEQLRSQLREILDRHKMESYSFRAEQAVNGVKITLQGANEPEDSRKMIGDLWTIAGVIEVEH